MKSQYTKIIIASILVCCAIAGSFYIGRRSVKKNVIYYSKQDTVIITETIMDKYPKLTGEKNLGFVKKTDVLIVHDTINDTDTLYVPIIQKEYSSPSYHAWISGYNAALDSVEVFPRTVYINKSNPRRWGLGLMGGYGFSSHGLTPFVGVGLYYKIF